MRKKIEHKAVGEEITVKCDEYGQAEHACWKKFRELKSGGLLANAFLIKTISIFENGSGEAIFQPVQV